MARQSLSRVASRFFMLSLLAAPFTAAAVTADFSFYPQRAQACLVAAQRKTDCSPATTSQELNGCLCGDGDGFITNSIECLEDIKADPDLWESVYSTMKNACNQSQTPMKLSQTDWVDILMARRKATATSSSEKDEPTTTQSEESSTSQSESETSTTQSDSETSTTQSETSSAKPTETDDAGKDSGKDENKDNEDKDEEKNKDKNDDDSSNGLPTGAIVGIAVGGAALLAIAGVLIWWLRRRRAEAPESDPMLTEHGGGFYQPHAGPTTYPPTEPMTNITSPGLAPAIYDQDHKIGRYSAISGISSPGNSPAHSPSSNTAPVSPQTYSWGAGSMGYAGAQQQQHYNQSLHPGAYGVPSQGVAGRYTAVPAHQSPHEGAVFEMDGTHIPAHRPSGPLVEMPGSEPSPYVAYRP